MKNHLSKCPWVSGSDLTTRDGAVSTSEKVLHSCGCALMQDGDKIGKKKKRRMQGRALVCPLVISTKEKIRKPAKGA